METIIYRSEKRFLEAYHKLIKRLKSGSITMKKHILDNEMLEAYREAIKMERIENNLVPPCMHRRNLE